MIGKRVIVNKRYVQDGEVVDAVQFQGVIETVDARSGFAVRRADSGALEWLPPDPRAFRPLPPGRYELAETGEVVRDPDFASSWTAERDLPFPR